MNLSNDRGAAHREEPELLKSNSGRGRPSRTLLAMHSCRTTFHSA